MKVTCGRITIEKDEGASSAARTPYYRITSSGAVDARLDGPPLLLVSQLPQMGKLLVPGACRRTYPFRKPSGVVS